VATGPTLSPLGQLATKVLVPGLGLPNRPVAGPPKRFAQAIGAIFSVAAAVLALGFGLDTEAFVLLAVLVVFATLESVFGFCMGCKVFGALMSLQVIPNDVCERCNNIAAQPRAGSPGTPLIT
jgi:hypothetical protein